MYHIKEDKRSEKSAELVVEGLYRCLARKPLAEITITDIQTEAGVGRATFYRLFDRKEDVLLYQCEQILVGLIDRHARAQGKGDWLCIALETWTAHKALVRSIVEQHREDLIIDAHIRMVPALQQAFGLQGMDRMEGEQFVVVLAALLIGTLTAWVRDGMGTSVEMLASRARKRYTALAPLFAE